MCIRDPRQRRSDPQTIGREVLVSEPERALIPLGQLAKISLTQGAPAPRAENALPSAYMNVDIRERDLSSYVAEAQPAVASPANFPPVYCVTWSGQFEYVQRAAENLKVVVPASLAPIFLLLYLNFRRLTETPIVLFSVPFVPVGSVCLMWWLGFNLSVATGLHRLGGCGRGDRGGDAYLRASGGSGSKWGARSLAAPVQLCLREGDRDLSAVTLAPTTIPLALSHHTGVMWCSSSGVQTCQTRQSDWASPRRQGHQ
ncbi:Cation efflux system protein CusA [Burkholderiales bacterium]|nr:Cation efflux system protein CusA [Burkholderiales bacterium]